MNLTIDNHRRPDYIGFIETEGTDDMLTIETAIAYVIQTEASWGLNPAVESAKVEGDCINVLTADNQWSVWLEADGSVYGEM